MNNELLNWKQQYDNAESRFRDELSKYLNNDTFYKINVDDQWPDEYELTFTNGTLSVEELESLQHDFKITWITTNDDDQLRVDVKRK